MPWSRFFRRKYWDEERAREMDAYIELETEENLARGIGAIASCFPVVRAARLNPMSALREA